MNRPRAWGPAPGRRLASAGQGLWRGFRRSWTQGLQLTLALALVLAGLLPLPLLQPQPAWAGPVDWVEVPASEAGRQWWDRGSLRLSKQGTLTVLSRFQPAAEPDPAEPAKAGAAPGEAALPPATKADATAGATAAAAPAPGASQGVDPAAAPPRRPRQPSSELYVSEIDCDQTLMRDTSINGIPQWRASWQPVAGDGLMEAVVEAVCEAGGQLLASR